jgi:hypothetical protein
VNDPWYPRADRYWVPRDEAGSYPVRQGDLFASPGDVPPGWLGFLVVSPSCEVQRKNTPVQIARIHQVDELAGDFQRSAVTFGYDMRDLAVVRVAYAHTFWMPPADDDGALAEPMFADLREVAVVPPGSVARERRARAMTHDARVAFIRRAIFHRYRWLLSLADVQAREAIRISQDRDFEGPRPAWASSPPG